VEAGKILLKHTKGKRPREVYFCMTAAEGAHFTNRQGLIDVNPKGMKAIDSGRRQGPLRNQGTELYYEGESIRVRMSSLGKCEETEAE
jgi:hypothetical protein